MTKDIKEQTPPDVKLPHPRKFSHAPDLDPYREPEPLLDPTSRFEQDDREDGMGVDDVKTYHRNEK